MWFLQPGGSLHPYPLLRKEYLGFIPAFRARPPSLLVPLPHPPALHTLIEPPLYWY